ncbi:MAG: His-Xaa-Ser system protein HxsD [Sandaracinus sp.]
MTEPAATTADFEYELSERQIRFVIDETVYPRDAIFGAAYIFIDRCYVLLDRPGDQKVSVRLRSKGPATEADLEALAGELANELLNQVLRLRVGESTARIREYYMARAFFASEGKSTIDQLLAELDAEEMAEAPLEVPVPWEKPSKPAGEEKSGG